MIDINLNPEFSYEIVCGLPYAYWLHQRGELKSITTSKGMLPFYYFCDNVNEIYERRSVSNDHNGVNSLPNNWIHHNAEAITGKDYSLLTEQEKYEVNGQLDYSEWTPPPLKKIYSDCNFKPPRPYIVICNRYNIEHNKPPRGYFSIEAIYNLVTYLTECGYDVVYKCPRNTEFTIDENEAMTLQQQFELSANVEDIGMINDYELIERLDNAHLLDDLIKRSGLEYNEAQLRVFANADGFISMAGGNGALASYFGVPNVTYVTTSGELRPGYFKGKSWYKMLSNADVIPVIDPEDEISKRGHDYEKLYKTVQNTYKGLK